MYLQDLIISSLCVSFEHILCHHYADVIMGPIASQLTSLTIVYSIVYSDVDQRKHQGSASLAFVWGIHRDRWIPRTKSQLRGKCFHLMTSSWLKLSDVIEIGQRDCEKSNGTSRIKTGPTEKFIQSGSDESKQLVLLSGLPEDSPHKGPVTQKALPCHDIILHLK